MQHYLNGSVSELPSDYNFFGIDLVKLICAYFVLAIHIFPVNQDNASAFQIYMWIKNFAFRLAVPFFFTVSGFLLFRKMQFDSLDLGRIKTYCFRILRLLGTWFALLIVGGNGQLWYLGALVTSVLMLTLMLKIGMKVRYIVIVGIVLYGIGLICMPYFPLIESLLDWKPIYAINIIYTTLFHTVRNGVFFGFIFVAIGAIYSQKSIVLPYWVAIMGFVGSMILLALEIRLLDHIYNAQAQNYEFFLSTIPASWFLFYLASHWQMKPRSAYLTIRIMSELIYFSHLFVCFLVTWAGEIFCHYLDRPSWNPLTIFMISLVLTTFLSFLIAWLSQKRQFRWLRYLYS